jgi:hypothetical protein
MIQLEHISILIICMTQEGRLIMIVDNVLLCSLIEIYLSDSKTESYIPFFFWGNNYSYIIYRTLSNLNTLLKYIL